MRIGRSISRSIIERHHGRRSATANDSPGATFAYSTSSEAHASWLGDREPAVQLVATQHADSVRGASPSLTSHLAARYTRRDAQGLSLVTAPRARGVCGETRAGGPRDLRRPELCDLQLADAREPRAATGRHRARGLDAYSFPNAVTARFGSGLTRELRPTSARESGLTVQDKRWVHGSFRFPSKDEFEHEDRLRIEFSFALHGQGTCEASLEFVRRPTSRYPKAATLRTPAVR